MSDLEFTTKTLKPCIEYDMSVLTGIFYEDSQL